MMQKLLLSIGIAFAAIGCTKDPYGTQSGDDALTITSNITTRVSDGQWDEKDAIGVYMTGEGVSSESANVEYTTADGDGTFTSSTPLYLPSSGSVEIFAYYPYVAEVDLAAYPIKSAEQVDLLSATATSVTSPSVALEFNHLLSKVSLTIENGEGLETADLAGLDVTISGISTEATFDVSEGEVNTLGEASALSLTTATEGTSSSAIVIPQTLSDATLYFDTKDYGTFSATLSTTEFKVGMEYKYTATLNCNGVEITSSNISGWGPNDAESGTASIVDIEYKSADDKYYINSAKGLAAFRDLVNDGGTNTQSATFAGFESSAFAEANLEIDGVLTRDIDLSDICNAEDGTSWAAIGNYTTQENPYNGTFDGGGFEISGLYINTALNQQGLFRRINTAGEVYNLGVSGSATNTSVSQSQFGGITAWNEGFIINCYSDVDVTGSNVTNVGGIAAYNVGNIVNCYNHGDITGLTNVGGIVGQNPDGGYVGYCISVGEVSGSRVGGVVGWNHSTTDEAPTVKGSFCLDNTDYSIGLNDYNSGTGGIPGNVCTADYLTSEEFAIIINNGAYTYNQNVDNVHADSPIEACAWVDNSPSGYTTLNFGVTPVYVNVYDIVYNSGTYEIYSNDGLRAFAALVNGSEEPSSDIVTSGGDDYFVYDGTKNVSISGKLMDDIDLNSVAWTPIGNSSNKYQGTFDGGGYEVSNLSVNNGDTYAGLFGYINGATIKNLGVSGTVNGNESVGGIAGYSDNSSLVINCYNSASVTVSSIQEEVYAGGIVGEVSSGSIINCYNTGDVSATSTYVTFVADPLGNDIGTFTGIISSGGIAGSTDDVITNCYSTGAVSANYKGIATEIYGSINNGAITGYTILSVTGTAKNITNCYWASDLSGTTYAVGNDMQDNNDTSESVTSMTSSEMKDVGFVTTLDGGATTYNTTYPDATQACGWIQGTDSYPTLNFGVEPSN